MPGDVVLVTATWRQDLDRFRLLRRSLREFALDETFHHVVAVHTEDLPLVDDFRGDRNLEIVPTSRLLDKEMERRRAAAHFGRTSRRHWVRGGPIAGWYAQQLTKLACAGIVGDAQAIAYFDSDTVVIRPFDHGAFIAADGRTKLFVDHDMRNDGSDEWNRTAARLLGVPTSAVETRQFIHTPTVVDVSATRELLGALAARVRRRGWQWTMHDANAFEYSTYGAWVTGNSRGLVELAPPMPALDFREHDDMWDFRQRVGEEIGGGSACFLSVQSRLHIPPHSYEAIVAQAWR